MAVGWGVKSKKECLESLESESSKSSDDNYCNGTWDAVMCWPATPAGETIRLPCPPIFPLDTSKLAHRVCDWNGTWERGPPSASAELDGWTNYTTCYSEMTIKFYFRITNNIPMSSLKELAYGTRILETIGLLSSLFALLISTFVFCYFRTLRLNHRIRIHRNLFLAVLVYTCVLLIRNIDQLIVFNSRFMIAESGIGSKPIFCEALIVLVEFTKTAMFTWMLIQGIHLQITLSCPFKAVPNYRLYYGLGWGISSGICIPWVIVNGILNKEICWYAYTYQNYFWALEGPRLLILCANLVFLCKIIYVLLSKMRGTDSSEKEQLRKAIKAMVILLPLLGINNLMHCIWPPITSQGVFIVWTYSAHFFSSFQGFFMALFYCFLNTEVKTTLSIHWNRYRLQLPISRVSSTSCRGSGSTKSPSAVNFMSISSSDNVAINQDDRLSNGINCHDSGGARTPVISKSITFSLQCDVEQDDAK